MVKKQVFAQISVFLLIGLNVAAYYFLWPNYHRVSSSEGNAPNQENGSTRLVPEAPGKPAPPKEIAPSLLKDAVPLSIPVSSPHSEPEKETISKLLDQVKKDNAVTLPLVTLPLEPTPAILPAPPQQPMPPHSLAKSPLDPSEFKHPYGVPVAVASALTPRMPPSAWQFNMEILGTRTQLLAKVRQPGTMNVVAEFKIVCDRVETKSPGGELQALGNVTVVGGGLHASCQRLILPIHETRLVFMEKAEIVHVGVAGGFLRGEQITWELPAEKAIVSPHFVTPSAELRPAGILPPALGTPK